VKPIKRILFLAPLGIGGIASFAENVKTEWNLENSRLILWRVPRSNFSGWISYFPKLFLYASYLLFVRPSIVHVHLASKGSPIRKFPFVLIAKILGIPVITQIHSGKLDEEILSRSTSSPWRVITTSILSLSQKLIFINQNQMKTLTDENIVPRSKSYFLANHVHLPDNLESEPKEPDFDVVFIGRVSKEKGALDLIESIKVLQHGSLSFAFVGDIQIPGYLVGSVEINNQKVTFFGEVPNSVAMEILCNSRILVLPSYSENFPMVILEAFARGKPVISTRVGEIENVVSEFSDGILFEAGDVKQLAAALAAYFDSPSAIAIQGKNARLKAELRYDIRDYAERLVAIYLS
jgi:glycosyltransferase involved in cell wall biosynthesis